MSFVTPRFRDCQHQYCLSTAASQSIEDVAAANDAGAASVKGHTTGQGNEKAKSPRFFQLYMGHDDDVVCPVVSSYFCSVVRCISDRFSPDTGMELRIRRLYAHRGYMATWLAAHRH